jgi:thiamine-phosphate pyrophosphorylase
LELYVISHPLRIANENAVIRDLFSMGLQTLHLRKPNCSLHEMEEHLCSIPSEYHDRIILHSHWQLCEKYHIKGLHGINDPLVPYPKDLTRSLSIHSLDEIKKLQLGYHHIFLSPIFNSISKEGYLSRFDHNVLNQFLKNTDEYIHETKIIALGGICPDNITTVQKLGFDGAAVLGSLWKDEGQKAVETFKSMKELICPIPSY